MAEPTKAELIRELDEALNALEHEKSKRAKVKEKMNSLEKKYIARENHVLELTQKLDELERKYSKLDHNYSLVAQDAATSEESYLRAITALGKGLRGR